jgi:hypothetical protein
MAESYANRPKTIGELRSDKSGRCDDWSARDLLINALRDIDAGESNPKAMVLAWYEEDPDAESGICTFYSASAPTLIDALGVLHRAAHRLNVKSDNG